MEAWKRNTQLRMSDALLKKDEGNALFKCGRYREAGECYIGALKDVIPVKEETNDIKSTRIACYSNLAACQINLEQYNRAILNCTKCLARDEKHVKCLYRRSTAYLKVNDLENASTDVEKLLVLSPNNTAALTLRKQLQKRLLDKDKQDALYMKKYFQN